MEKIKIFNRLLVFFIASGLLVLAFEIYLQHYHQLSEKKIMWLPIVFGAVGGFSCLLISIFMNRVTYFFFLFFMLLSIGVGVLGMYFHNKWRFPMVMEYFAGVKPFEFEMLTEYTPLIAPSAFIAMGGLGILMTIFYRWDDW